MRKFDDPSRQADRVIVRRQSAHMCLNFRFYILFLNFVDEYETHSGTSNIKVESGKMCQWELKLFDSLNFTKTIRIANESHAAVVNVVCAHTSPEKR